MLHNRRGKGVRAVAAFGFAPAGFEGVNVEEGELSQVKAQPQFLRLPVVSIEVYLHVQFIIQKQIGRYIEKFGYFQNKICGWFFLPSFKKGDLA